MMTDRKDKNSMEVKFENYRFLSDQFILYKNEELIPLKRNQAVLLNFFLSDPEGIHSKDDILDAVWKNRVVSEQVVFQTISQLRSLLGDEAIKTFSKKGYKWQLTPTPVLMSSDEASELGNTLSDKSVILASTHSQTPSFTRFLTYLLILITVLMISIFLYNQQATNDTSTTLNDAAVENKVSFHVLQNKNNMTPSQTQFNNIIGSSLAQNTAFKTQQKIIDSSARQAFSAPKLVWQQANLTLDDWLVWGDLYHSTSNSPEKGIFLNYGLARNKIHWQGYLFAENIQQLEKALTKKLKDLESIGLFSISKDAINIEMLLTMYKVLPSDPDLLLLIAEHYINVQHFDVALTYLQKLTDINNSFGFSAYQAKAQWYIGKVYKMRRQHIQAANSLDKMSEILAETPLWPLIFHSINTNAWLAHDRNDYHAMLEIGERGLEHLIEHADPLTLFELHILNSIAAKKASDDHKKYIHLNQAQALLLKHNLDDSNLAVVYYHFAIFSKEATSVKDKATAIPYLERILTLPRTVQNYWVLDNALEMLVSYHLDNNDFDNAHSLFTNKQLKAKELVLKAKVFQAQQKLDKAKPLLLKAFELARLNFSTHTGLEAALMLYQISHESPIIKAEYLAYIQSNASENWLKRHREEIASKL